MSFIIASTTNVSARWLTRPTLTAMVIILMYLALDSTIYTVI